MFAELVDWFTYDFFIYALIVGVLISACSSCLGVSLVLKRYSLIGDGLSHVAFGAMCVAAVFNVTNNLYIVMPVTVIAAIILLGFSDKLGLKGDAAIAMISVTALALGYFVISKFYTGNVMSDVCTSLFGSSSIYTLSLTDIITCVVMSILVAAFYIFFYNKIFAVTFDENFMQATGVKSRAYNLMIAVVTAVIIALAMQIVGSLLITALIIFPALSAMKLFKSYRAVVIFSVCFSVIAAFLGIIISVLATTPTGSTIVLTDAVMFFICVTAGAIKRKISKRGAK